MAPADPNIIKYDRAYVDAHCATRNFYHRGKGVWLEGLPPPGSDPRTGVKGPGAAQWKAQNTNQTAAEIARTTQQIASSIAPTPTDNLPSTSTAPSSSPQRLIVVLPGVTLEAALARRSASSTAPPPSLVVRLPIAAPAPLPPPAPPASAGIPPARAPSSRLAAKRKASPPPPPPSKRRQPASKPRAAASPPSSPVAPPRWDDNGVQYLANRPRNSVELGRAGLDSRGGYWDGGRWIARGVYSVGMRSTLSERGGYAGPPLDRNILRRAAEPAVVEEEEIGGEGGESVGEGVEDGVVEEDGEGEDGGETVVDIVAAQLEKTAREDLYD